MRISDWSSDVCSSDLRLPRARRLPLLFAVTRAPHADARCFGGAVAFPASVVARGWHHPARTERTRRHARTDHGGRAEGAGKGRADHAQEDDRRPAQDFHPPDPACKKRSEEHTSELQSLMRITY